MSATKEEMSRLIEALSTVRTSALPEECDIHAAIAQALAARGLPCVHEYRLGPRRRIDFLSGRVGIEVKKGRPAAQALLGQLRRYAESDELDGLIVVTQRTTPLPDAIAGKPVVQVSLNRLWGVALP